VRVLGHRRTPRVEHRGEPDASAEVLWVGRDRNQRLGRGFEQDAVDHRLVVVGNIGDGCRHCEHDVEIGHRQEFGLAVGQPLLGSGGLALWAMHRGQPDQRLPRHPRCQPSSPSGSPTELPEIPALFTRMSSRPYLQRHRRAHRLAQLVGGLLTCPRPPRRIHVARANGVDAD